MAGKAAKDRTIASLAAAQYGVASRAQLMRVGLTSDEIDGRLASGRLHVVHRGVYAVGHRVMTTEGRWLAATLATSGPLSHATAAAAWDLRPATGAIHVTVAGVSGRDRRPGLRIHRSITLRPEDVTVRRGIPVTTPIRTVLDVATTVKGRRLEQILDRAERLIDFGELRRRLEDHSARAGSPSLRAVLSRYTVGAAMTRSELEEAFLRLCDDQPVRRRP